MDIVYNNLIYKNQDLLKKTGKEILADLYSGIKTKSPLTLLPEFDISSRKSWFQDHTPSTLRKDPLNDRNHRSSLLPGIHTGT